MSGSDSPTFFHGQPWSSWIEKIGRDKPLSDEEPDAEPASSVMRLSVDDIDLYGFCPERDTFYGVVCEICNSIIKPQAFTQHMESRHPSGSTNLPPPPNSATKSAMKTPYCKLSKLKKSQSSGQLPVGNNSGGAGTTNNSSGKTSNNHTPVKQRAAAEQHPVKSPGSQQPKRKRLKAERSLLKDREYDPDRHCGVWNEETGKPCTRSLTCKAHTVSLRRTVAGRSKTFDKLLAEHRASKELPSTRPSVKVTPATATAAGSTITGTISIATADLAATTGSTPANISATTISAASVDLEAPSSPPVLSLPDTYPLPQLCPFEEAMNSIVHIEAAVDLLYRCLAPHGSNKPTKLEEDFANELESNRRIEPSVVNNSSASNGAANSQGTNSNTASSSGTAPMAPHSVALPSLSPIQTDGMSPQASILQYSRTVSSPIASVEQIIGKQSPASAPVVPTVLPVSNQPASSTTMGLEAKPVSMDIDTSQNITMYTSPVYKDSGKPQVTVQISRSNAMPSQSTGGRVYSSLFDSSLHHHNSTEVSRTTSYMMTNGKRISNHLATMQSQIGRAKHEFPQEYSTAIQLEATTTATPYTSFNDISWSTCHPEPLAAEDTVCHVLYPGKQSCS
ncbi:hypothetical protein TSAR_015497 [Trichomalopsis sarcophagae]|uniref:SCA7 domain-containing protein n=1 Tax=Trichomalopsis sarcophagae TaxID=543379 RepID=A0A232ERK7_9HYME|nr:hypothetical protein TSAR_015497 [Trichomalopsis sarcophagae]